MLEELREEVWRMNLELPKNRLVSMTSGNVSARDKETNYVIIKPSGMNYDDLKPSHMVVIDLKGKVIEGALKPSVDTSTHLYIYQHRDDVNGVVHTHSNYASSFAALGRPIPVYLTAMADEFGGPIPVGDYAQLPESNGQDGHKVNLEERSKHSRVVEKKKMEVRFLGSNCWKIKEKKREEGSRGNNT
ncbi:unnamed protein product [marine sediment metagenome]|uniref:Class II aldolase/adducin N-terminal domain-containing protein n=1 Tax=marine sediment metagenome TaxID=412755 RepID=X1PID6_9ZZZZ